MIKRTRLTGSGPGLSPGLGATTPMCKTWMEKERRKNKEMPDKAVKTWKKVVFLNEFLIDESLYIYTVPWILNVNMLDMLALLSRCATLLFFNVR